MEVRTKINIPLFARQDGDKQLQEQDGSAPAPFIYYQGGYIDLAPSCLC